MTAPGAASASSPGGTRRWVWPAVGVMLVLSVLMLGAPNEEGAPYDPSNNGEMGTKALVLLIEAFGGQVEVSEEVTSDTDVAVVFPDEVALEDEDDLRAWARQGHTIVVLDPRSDLTPVTGSQAGVAGLSATRIDQNECTIDALRGVEALKLDGNGVRFDVPEGGLGCFTREGDAFIVAVPEGDGQIISIGAPSVFTNTNLDEDDNAVLATALLVPEPGTTVRYLRRSGEGRMERRDITALIPIGVKFGMVQMMLGFVVYALFRGRRLGRPIPEPQPVLIAGSELVAAVGNLLQQTKNPAQAAAILRGDLRRTLADRLGLGAGASPELIADTAAARSGADPARVRSAVTDYPVSDEVALLAVAKLVDEVREEVLHGRTV